MKQRYQLLAIAALLAVGSETIKAGALKQAFTRTSRGLTKAWRAVRSVPQARLNFLYRTEQTRENISDKIQRAGIYTAAAGISTSIGAMYLDDVIKPSTAKSATKIGSAAFLAGLGIATIGTLPPAFPFATAVVVSAGLYAGTVKYFRPQRQNQKQQ